MSSRHSVPATVKPRFEEIVGLIEAVCRAHLTEEYATVPRALQEQASELGLIPFVPGA